MKAIFERLEAVTNVESLNPKERAVYEADLKVYRDYTAQRAYATKEGFEKGKKESIGQGEKVASLRIAKPMKQRA